MGRERSNLPGHVALIQGAPETPDARRVFGEPLVKGGARLSLRARRVALRRSILRAPRVRAGELAPPTRSGPIEKRHVSHR